jgi:tRNA-splicing ligase RtcB
MVIYESDGGKPIKAWTEGVPVEDEALAQVKMAARLPFIEKWIALMPDVHVGKGSTIGSVIPTSKAIIPAAVGVDIGCGMAAVRLSLTASQLPDNLHAIRSAIEAAVPVGRTVNGGYGDAGAWKDTPESIMNRIADSGLPDVWKRIVQENPKIEKGNLWNHCGTLGTGNHFIEICLDESQNVWVMLHSGSRGVGNRIGSFFIEKAKEEMERFYINLPDKDLAYLPEGSKHFHQYMLAVDWAQNFARLNREVMMNNVIMALEVQLGKFQAVEETINCHHNYVEREHHFGKNLFITRKGAVRARLGDMGIIPGSMGAKSFIVRGKGNKDSFDSCSHGAGRKMSRTKAKAMFTVQDQINATEGVECRKDAEVIDEIPMAYKDIDAVMNAQSDLVEIVHTLKQVVCVKG